MAIEIATRDRRPLSLNAVAPFYCEDLSPSKLKISIRHIYYNYDLKCIVEFIIVAGLFALSGANSWIDAINISSSFITIGDWLMKKTFSANGIGKSCEEPCHSLLTGSTILW